MIETKENNLKIIMREMRRKLFIEDFENEYCISYLDVQKNFNKNLQ